MLDVVGPEDVREVGDEELSASLFERQRIIDQHLAAQAVELHEWRTRGLWADGSRRPHGHLARETGMSQNAAKQRLYRAKRLMTMPLTLKAALTGSLSSSRIDLLVHANQTHLEELFVRDEEMLLTSVRELPYWNAKRVIAYWIQQADEEGTKEKAKRQLEQRTAYLSRTFEGSLDIRILSDPLSGDIIENEHQRLCDIEFKKDWAEAKELYGDNVGVHLLRRTAAQRRHDAFVEMAKRSAAMAPGSVMPRTLVNIVQGRQGFEHMCQTAGGTVIAPDLVLPHLADADIERIVFDGPSRVIDLGAQRSFRGALRRVLDIRDEHCQHESECDVLAPACEGDHVVAYTKGGPTEQNNGQLLCDFHNRSKGSGPPEDKVA